MQATDATYNGGSFDAFVTKLATSGGSLDFSTYLGGSSDDRGYGIAVNGATGRVYVAGQTDSSGFPTTAGGFDTSYNGGFDAFVTKLAPVGSTLTRRQEPVGGPAGPSGPDRLRGDRQRQRAGARPSARHRAG